MGAAEAAALAHAEAAQRRKDPQPRPKEAPTKKDKKNLPPPPLQIRDEGRGAVYTRTGFLGEVSTSTMPVHSRESQRT